MLNSWQCWLCSTTFFEENNEFGDLPFYWLVEFNNMSAAMFVNINKSCQPN